MPASQPIQAHIQMLDVVERGDRSDRVTGLGKQFEDIGMSFMSYLTDEH